MVVLHNLFSLVWLVWPFVVIVIGFGAFVVKNGGIVVGKSMSMHTSITIHTNKVYLHNR